MIFQIEQQEYLNSVNFDVTQVVSAGLNFTFSWISWAQ